MTKPEAQKKRCNRVLRHLVIRASFGFRHSDFVIAKRLLCLLIVLVIFSASARAADTPSTPFPRPAESYQDANIPGIGAKLWGRIVAEPFNIVATLIFFCAIVHTFLTSRFLVIAHKLQVEFDSLEEKEKDPVHGWDAAIVRDRLQFRSQLFHFMGEVEVVFGIWLIPLALAIVLFKGWDTMMHYASGTSFAEPVFVVVVMAISATRPVLELTGKVLSKVAALGGGRPAAWWLAILTIGPLLGSFITEPAAMTICALLLSERIYALEPSMRLRYATLGLLFVDISVGGTLTHFAAPPVVMVAHTWGWGLAHMAANFGWKAVLGIIVSNIVYFLVFGRELLALKAPPPPAADAAARPVPLNVTIVHLLFIAWVVATAHYPPLVVIGFLFFMAYQQATERHQEPAQIRGPLLVGFFLAALVIHGGCQQWWLGPVLASLTKWPLMIGATLLTAVNDNAAITYLASLVPDFSDTLRYVVVAGAVTGGGLTVIANAPNPAGQSILQSRFGDGGISPAKLFLAALAPTLIVGAAFMLL